MATRARKTTARPGTGFAAMDPEVLKEIARKGGVTAHKLGRGRQFTKEEARLAGKKGGLATAARKSIGGFPTAPSEAMETAEIALRPRRGRLSTKAPRQPAEANRATADDLPSALLGN